MLNHFLWPIPFHTISSQAGLGSDIILTHALIFNLMASPPYSYTDMYGTQRALPLSENHEDQSITSGDPSSISYIPRAARSVPHAHTVHTIHVKKVTYYPLTSRLNYIIKMDWKRGAPLRPSWATFNSLRIPESYGRWQTSSAFITRFNQFRHLRPRSHSTQCFHTQNIRMCNLDNPFQSFRTIRSFSNRVGDVLLTIIYHHSQGSPTSLRILAPFSHYTSDITVQAAFATQCFHTHGTGIFVISSSIWPE
jgi:hypothetical protein